MDLHQARSNMIEQQVRPWDVLEQRVLDVLADMPREDFVADAYRGIAYSDYALPIGHGQHLLKPTLDGRLLQALALTDTDTVLEIGTGSGYLTACMARLAGYCESLEIIAELSETAAQHLKSLGLDNVRLLVQDAAADWDARDAYDAILFGGSLVEVPDFYKRRLRPGGRLAAIVGDPSRPTQEAILMTRSAPEHWHVESLFETRVAPLAHFTQAPSSTFVF